MCITFPLQAVGGKKKKKLSHGKNESYLANPAGRTGTGLQRDYQKPRSSLIEPANLLIATGQRWSLGKDGQDCHQWEKRRLNKEERGAYPQMHEQRSVCVFYIVYVYKLCTHRDELWNSLNCKKVKSYHFQ